MPSNFANFPVGIVRSQQFSMGTGLLPVGTDFRVFFQQGQLFGAFSWWGGGPSGAVTQGFIKSGKKSKRSVKIYNYLSFLAFISIIATKDGKNERKNQESTKMIVKITLVIYLHNLNKPRKRSVLYFF